MTWTLFWISAKAFFKKFLAWCKKYWQFLVGAAIPVVIMILAGKKGSGRLLKRVQEDHEKELEAIENARLRELEKLKRASDDYKQSLEDIEKKYNELSEDLEEEKKQKIESLLKENKEDPEALTEKISEIMGFDLYN